MVPLVTYTDSWNLDALQKTAEDMVKEDGPEKSMKRTVPVGEVTKAFGTEMEAWKAAARAESITLLHIDASMRQPKRNVRSVVVRFQCCARGRRTET